MTVRVEQGDALNLTTVDNESVDLVVTSPPYFALRVYKDSGEVLEAVGNEDSPEGYLKSLDCFMEEMWRVLKPSGSVFVVLGDKFAGSGGHNNSNITDDAERGPKSYNKEAGGIRAKSLMGLPWRFALRQMDAGWILRQEIIWSKPNGMPESTRDRCRRSHEQIFHFTKQGDYYAAVDRIRTPNKDMKEDWVHIGESKEYHTGEIMSEGTNLGLQTSAGMHRQKGGVYNPLGALPRSVWEISTSGLRVPAEVIAMLQVDKHYAAYPPELVKRIVEGWSPEDGNVLDPFGGVGTTALVASLLNRDAITIDLSSGYTRLAAWRLFISDHGSKLQAKWAKQAKEQNATSTNQQT